jgi:hypothetical protein
MIYDSYDVEVIADRMEMEAEVIREMNEMNEMKEFEFVYYGWLPGYGDFDIDSETIKATSQEEAEKIFWKTKRFIKNGPSIKQIA